MTERLVFIPLCEDEIKMSKTVKKLAVQDETTQHDLLLEALELLFVAHKIDLGGNPQRQLLSFDDAKVMQVKLGKCGYAGCKEKQAVAVGVYAPTGKEYQLCKLHRTLAVNNPQIWRLIK